jgi:hypothetical protein
VRLSDNELAMLERRVAKTGMTRSAILRKDFLENAATQMEKKQMQQKTGGHVLGR